MAFLGGRCHAVGVGRVCYCCGAGGLAPGAELVCALGTPAASSLTALVCVACCCSTPVLSTNRCCKLHCGSVFNRQLPAAGTSGLRLPKSSWFAVHTNPSMRHSFPPSGIASVTFLRETHTNSTTLLCCWLPPPLLLLLLRHYGQWDGALCAWCS